jgi:enamidase
VVRLHLLFALALLIACGGGAAPEGTPSGAPTSTGDPTLTTNSGVQTQAPSGSLAIINGTLIDGTGAAPIPNAYVLIGNGSIEAAGCCSSAISLPSGYEVIDAAGGTIMPGLVDAHVHVTSWVLGNDAGAASMDATQRLVPWLESGFTTLRDVGAPLDSFPGLRQQIDRLVRDSKSPNVVWSGPIVTAVGGYPLTVPAYAPVGREVASVDEARALVRDLADAGAGVIKLGLEGGYYSDLGWALLSLDTIRAIVEVAHERAMRVAAHVTSIDELTLALDGRIDDIVHAPLERIPDALLARMVEEEVGMTTTATVWGQAGAPAVAAANASRYAAAGGLVAIGTDFGCCSQQPGLEPYLQEMRFLLQAGMTPMQIVVAATRNAAIVAGRGGEAGTIESGKAGDILVVQGDPLGDVGALRDPVAVIQAGRVVKG